MNIQNASSALPSRPGWLRFALYLSALFALVYVFIRARELSLTWDEAYTFFEYVRHPSWLPHDFNYMSANNHLLNTWLMKCSIFFFGEGELALRLPNVIAGGFFLFSLGRLLQKIFSNSWFAFAAFLLTGLNPYVLDFFSLARGYGISLAFLMTGLYRLAVYLDENDSLRQAVRVLSLFIFATLANLTMLHVLGAVTFVLLIDRLLKREDSSRVKKSIVIFLVPAIFVAALWPYLRRLDASGAFFFGKEIDSPFGTIQSLASSSAYGHTGLVPFLSWFFLVIPAFAILLLALRPCSSAQRWSIALLAVLLLSFVTPVIQHYLLGNNFLSGRTGIFMLPLLALSLAATAQALPKFAGNVLAGKMAVAGILLFVFSFNLHHTLDFREQADVKTMMLGLKQQNIPLEKNVFANVIATDLPWDAPVNYYRSRLDLQNFGHAGRKVPVPGCSWYYGYRSDMPGKAHADILCEFPLTNTVLYRLKNPEQSVYLTETWKNFEVEDPYAELLRDTFFIGEQGTFAGGGHLYSIGSPITIPDSLKGRVTAATVQCRLNYQTRNTSALFAFVVETEKSEQPWYTMHLTELSVPPGEWSMTGWTIPVPADVKKIRVFLWNTDEKRVYMDNVALRLLGKPAQRAS